MTNISNADEVRNSNADVLVLAIFSKNARGIPPEPPATIMVIIYVVFELKAIIFYAAANKTSPK